MWSSCSHPHDSVMVAHGGHVKLWDRISKTTFPHLSAYSPFHAGQPRFWGGGTIGMQAAVRPAQPGTPPSNQNQVPIVALSSPQNKAYPTSKPRFTSCWQLSRTPQPRNTSSASLRNKPLWPHVLLLAEKQVGVAPLPTYRP